MTPSESDPIPPEDPRARWHLVPFEPFPVEYPTEGAFRAALARPRTWPAYRLVRSLGRAGRPARVTGSDAVWAVPLTPPVRGVCAACGGRGRFGQLTGSVLLHARCLRRSLPARVAEEVRLLASPLVEVRTWRAVLEGRGDGDPPR